MAARPSPPKPWEVAGAAGGAAAMSNPGPSATAAVAQSAAAVGTAAAAAATTTAPVAAAPAATNAATPNAAAATPGASSFSAAGTPGAANFRSAAAPGAYGGTAMGGNYGSSMGGYGGSQYGGMGGMGTSMYGGGIGSGMYGGAMGGGMYGNRMGMGGMMGPNGMQNGMQQAGSGDWLAGFTQIVSAVAQITDLLGFNTHAVGYVFTSAVSVIDRVAFGLTAFVSVLAPHRHYPPGHPLHGKPPPTPEQERTRRQRVKVVRSLFALAMIVLSWRAYRTRKAAAALAVQQRRAFALGRAAVHGGAPQRVSVPGSKQGVSGLSDSW